MYQNLYFFTVDPERSGHLWLRTLGLYDTDLLSLSWCGLMQCIFPTWRWFYFQSKVSPSPSHQCITYRGSCDAASQNPFTFSSQTFSPHQALETQESENAAVNDSLLHVLPLPPSSPVNFPSCLLSVREGEAGLIAAQCA